MKQLKFDLGGRPLASDDLVVLQEQINKTASALLSPFGPIIVQGCEVTKNSNYTIDISAGVVFLNNKLLVLDEVKGLGGNIGGVSPVFIVEGPTSSYQSDVYQNGVTQDVITETKAIVVRDTTGIVGEEIEVLYNQNPLRWNKLKGLFEPPVWHDVVFRDDLEFLEQYTNVSITKDQFGFVHMRGNIGYKALARNWTIATLPSEYSPSEITYLYGSLYDHACYIESGEIKVSSKEGVVVFDGVSYYA